MTGKLHMLDLNINHQYRGRAFNYELQLEKGVHGIVGPSGAGKTQLLRMLLGTVRPGVGRIVFNDRLWLDSRSHVHLPAQKRGVGMVFQDYALFPHLNVHDNVFFTPGPADYDRTSWLEKFKLAGLAHSFPSTLSGGEAQRVALARTLWSAPDLLLLDEPFAALDRSLRKILRSQVEDLVHEISIPTMIVSHDLDEIASLCDTVTVITEGKIAQTGSVKEVLNHPVNETVARFLTWENIYEGKEASRLFRLDGRFDRLKKYAISHYKLSLQKRENALILTGYVESLDRRNLLSHLLLNADGNKVHVHASVQAATGISVGDEICLYVEDSDIIELASI